MTQATIKSGEAWPAVGPGEGAVAAGLWRPMWAMWHREVVRFVRQRNRVMGALVNPILFWVLLGLGFSHSLHIAASAGKASAGAGSAAAPGGGGMGALAFFFPGVILMILLFTAIFSTITVIEDRREGFLQGVMVCPAPRLSIVLGKILGGASIAMAQGLLFLLVWPLVGGAASVGHVLTAIAMMAVLSLGITATSLCIAWPMDSTAGFHAVMMVVLMPMWFLSGALFPVSGASVWLRALMYVDPLTYGQSVLSWAILGTSTTVLAPWVAAAVSVAFAAAMVLAAARIAGRAG